MPGLGDGHLHGGVELSTCGMGYEGGTVEAILAKLKACLLRDDQVAHLKSNFVLRPDQFNVNGTAPADTTITRHDLDRLSKDPSQDTFGTGTTRPIVIRTWAVIRSSRIRKRSPTSPRPRPLLTMVGGKVVFTDPVL